MADGFELHLVRTFGADYDSAAGVLRAGPERWLPGFAVDGDRVTAELAFDQAGRRIGRRIEVALGTVQPFAYGVTVRVQWQAVRRPHLYPTLDGHLRLEPGQDAGCRLRFDVRYVPPAGKLGASVDRALLYRVADATVGDFLDRVAAVLDAKGASPQPAPAPERPGARDG